MCTIAVDADFNLQCGNKLISALTVGDSSFVCGLGKVVFIIREFSFCS